MSRPMRDGVDYFPKDTDFYNDDKVRMLRSEFGIKGMYLLDYLLCDLYGKNGYYMNWNGDKCYLVSDGAGCGCDSKFVEEFVRGCVRRSFFDEGVFTKFGVLTSQGIQRRYIRMLNNRKNIILNREYFLLDVSNDNDVPGGVLEKITFIGETINGNPDKSNGNPDKSNGNPIKKKENKIKENKTNYQEVVDLFHDTCVSYPRVTALSDKRKAAIGARMKMYSIDDFRRMFEKAEASDFLKGANNRNWSANFDWLMCDSNFAKVLDGNYDNRGTTGKGDTGNVFLKMLQDEYG